MALQEFNPLEYVQLAVTGYNSVGKTSFMHELLGCGDFLPVDKGAVTARIVKFSYASQENACLIQYVSVRDLTEVGDRIDLSAHFKTGVSTKTRGKGLRKVVREHVGRPEGMDPQSDEFAQWAKMFVEIRLPSENLKPGLHVYDTPGFLGSDPLILRENLLALVGSVLPTIVFLYDNPTGSDDSRKCYNELKVALRSERMGIDIFFLNTKADVAIIRKDASNNDDDDDDDDEQLINKERLSRYGLLMKIDEMKGDVHERDLGEMEPSFDQCESFDMFTTASPSDPMELAIKRHAINRIIRFAAKHDLRLTKYVINIVHEAIDAFFDFVLVTNRRSTDEWNKLRDDALQWGENFFEQYRSAIDTIANEVNRRLPERFREKRLDIEKKATDDCETRGIRWDERLDIQPPTSHSFERRRLFNMIRTSLQSVKNISRDYRNDEQTFIDILIEREVTKPVLLDIITQESDKIKQKMSKDYTFHRSKNELLYAAYREVLIEIGNFGDMNQLSVKWIILKSIGAIITTPLVLATFMVYSVPFALIYLWNKEKVDKQLQSALDHRKQGIRHYLLDLEATMNKMGNQMKTSMLEWIDQEHKKYKQKVNGYHRVVCRTIQDRQKAFQLARLFVPKFVRIECHLEANLHLAAHHGSRPVVTYDEVLGTGGFFTVYPASWDDEHGVIAHMHAFDLVHRDIKVENILMDEHEDVYLGDFGTCQHGTENSTLVGSFPLSPDLTTLLQLTASSSSSDRQYSYEGTAVDVYLLGVLMFVCAPKEVYIPPSNRILEQVQQLDRTKVSENYCTLIVRCLEKDPKRRPTAQAIADELDAMTERLS
ncbi:unnamed protein product [Adineta steineri]|uniref:Protein kinase domain-containing protein n=1 Tax=Adineta steineri TaxID=433720 RepID=A0A815KH43_9BILA|nr:unnamed protein product [Adineta steineri]CAF3623418.1 unnamed protein product [Adineta steineri]